MLFAECSSKDDIGIDNLFELVINTVLDTPSLSKETKVGGSEDDDKGVTLESNQPSDKAGGDCYC